VPVLLQHPEPTDSVALEIELDQHRRFVANNPPIMSRFDANGLRSHELQGAAIRVLNMDLTAGKEPDMRVQSEIGADDRLHVRGPAKPGRVDHAAGAGPHDIDLGAANFAAFGAGYVREQWIVDAHGILRADSAIAEEFYQIILREEGLALRTDWHRGPARDGNARSLVSAHCLRSWTLM
jgi:hypothetical protein